MQRKDVLNKLLSRFLLQLSRKDYSPYLVHMCRRYENAPANKNLVNILYKKTIEARSCHNFFTRDIDMSNFDDGLKRKFHTVSFTEIPISELRKITGKIKGRSIQLEPVGIVFYKHKLLINNVTPVIYINTIKNWANKSRTWDLWKNDFETTFRQITSYKQFRQENIRRSSSLETIRKFALTSKIDTDHDFHWEREWRHRGDFKFNYDDVAAIIVNNPIRLKNKLDEYKKSNRDNLKEFAFALSKKKILSIKTRRHVLLQNIEKLEADLNSL